MPQKIAGVSAAHSSFLQVLQAMVQVMAKPVAPVGRDQRLALQEPKHGGCSSVVAGGPENGMEGVRQDARVIEGEGKYNRGRVGAERGGGQGRD